MKPTSGGNLFQLVVTTPIGLKRFAEQAPEHPIPDRNLLVVRDYSWDLLLQTLQDIVAKCTRRSWDESVACLQRYFLWEYEDYTPA